MLGQGIISSPFLSDEIFSKALLHIRQSTAMKRKCGSDDAKVIWHAYDLQYRAFTLTVMENYSESKAVTGDEIWFQSICHEETFQELVLLRLK